MKKTTAWETREDGIRGLTQFDDLPIGTKVKLDWSKTTYTIIQTVVLSFRKEYIVKEMDRHIHSGDIIAVKKPVSTEYVITGKDKRGKRFIIHTDTPQHYNIWVGTLWRIENGKRKFVKRYYN